jgi:hypothetical protein
MIDADCIRKGPPTAGIVCIAIALMVSVPAAKAAELWDFVQVGKNFVKGPKWESRNGKALIEIQKGRINIRASYLEGPSNDAPDKLTHEAIKISGTLASDNSIQATCIFLDTDANPVKLSGQYITRDELQIWGEKRKIITQKEIVFSHPPNFEFFGFLRQDARDE